MEAGGLTIGAVGFSRTWREFSTGGRLFERDHQRFRRMWHAFARRVLRRRPARTIPIGAAIELNWSMQANLQVAFGPLPSLAESPLQFVWEVERRLNQVHDIVQDLQQKLLLEAGVRKSADEDLRKDLQTQIEMAEAMSRSIAVGGLREQVIGWSCIAGGFLLQVVAALMLAGSS